MLYRFGQRWLLVGFKSDQAGGCLFIFAFLVHFDFDSNLVLTSPDSTGNSLKIENMLSELFAAFIPKVEAEEQPAEPPKEENAAPEGEGEAKEEEEEVEAEDVRTLISVFCSKCSCLAFP